MKGVIVDCLRGLVENKFGKEKWKEALELAGFPPRFIPLSNQDIFR